MAKRKKSRRKSNPAFKSHIAETISHWIFLVGVAMAIVLGILLPDSAMIASVLVIIGLVVGLMNITSKEVLPFLLATIALTVSAKSFQLIPFFGTYLKFILDYVVILVAPAAVVVALIVIWRLASTR